MATKTISRTRSMVVTYRGIDSKSKRLSVTRQARGRNGQIRPISLAVPFARGDAYRRFREGVRDGKLLAGKSILLVLERTSGEHRCAVAVDFALTGEEVTL